MCDYTKQVCETLSIQRTAYPGDIDEHEVRMFRVHTVEELIEELAELQPIAICRVVQQYKSHQPWISSEWLVTAIFH